MKIPVRCVTLMVEAPNEEPVTHEFTRRQDGSWEWRSDAGDGLMVYVRPGRKLTDDDILCAVAQGIECAAEAFGV